jgi:hypothetical protein
MSSRVKHITKFRTSKKHNTMRVHLKTNNLSLCLNHEYLESVLHKNILK